MVYIGEQKREYQRKWKAARRSAYFQDKCCVVCGSKENMELDHIDPASKKYNPAALWSMSETNPNRIAELEKCQVLCHKHHLEKTIAWKASNRSHGFTLYNHGCRCEICYGAMSRHNAKRTKKN